MPPTTDAPSREAESNFSADAPLRGPAVKADYEHTMVSSKPAWKAALCAVLGAVTKPFTTTAPSTGEPVDRALWDRLSALSKEVPAEDWARVPRDASRNLARYQRKPTITR
jgi:hypothetical protein